MINSLSPHPLDFDWRYDATTALALASMLQDSSPIVAIGTPTVANILEARGIDVTLVDRQPIQAVGRHIVCLADDFIADRIYQAALVDPPWYPAPLRRWSEAAGRAVGAGGTVFVSIWPSTTRPSAEAEVKRAVESFSQWAVVHRNAAVLRYIEPRFETVAREHGKGIELSMSPLTGELIRLDVCIPPPILLAKHTVEQWLRFAINDYQLAIRRRPGDDYDLMEPILSADGWHWPYVSARAPGIDQIDVWSSDGEVARLRSPERLIDTIRRALQAPNCHVFEQVLVDAPALLSWHIPRPPYWRLIEWSHRQ